MTKAETDLVGELQRIINAARGFGDATFLFGHVTSKDVQEALRSLVEILGTPTGSIRAELIRERGALATLRAVLDLTKKENARMKEKLKSGSRREAVKLLEQMDAIDEAFSRGENP